jgi:coatomer protein complex subunit alpha (xenin)
VGGGGAGGPDGDGGVGSSAFAALDHDDDDDDGLGGGGGGGGGWGDDMDDLDVLGDGASGAGGAGAGAGGAGLGLGSDDEGGGWEVEDIALPDIPATAKATTSGFASPSSGVSVAERWSRAASVAGEYVAAGDFDGAFKVLRSTIGVRVFAPLRPAFMAVALASQATIPTLPGAGSLVVSLCRDPKRPTPALDASATGGEGAGNGPCIAVTVPMLVERLKVAYKLTTGGKFGDALATFLSIIHTLPLVVVETRGEVNEVKELLNICKEYVIAIRLELKRKALKDDPTRGCQLAALFSHCALQPIHLTLSLQVAMMAAYKVKNLQMALGLARRLSELNPKPEIAAKAAKLIAVCQQNPTDESPVDYDDRNPFVVCAGSMTPVYRGSPLVRCLYCAAAYKPEYKGSTCAVCEVAEVGAEGPGLTVSPSQLARQ